MQYTYNTLFASCQNYCVDNSVNTTVQSYATEFPNIVQLAEMRIIKDLNLSVFDTVATGVLSPAVNELLKPDDLIVIQDFFIFVNNNRFYLQQRSKSYLDFYWPNSSTVGQPIYFADNTTQLWQIAPTTDQSYNYQINYVARPTPMSSTNQNTWIGDKLGECLLYATLVASMGYFREDVANEQGITGYWEKSYQLGIAQALRELAPMISGKDNELSTLTKIVR